MKLFYQLIAIVVVFCSTQLYAQPLSMYEKHQYIKNNDTLPYRLLLPEQYDAQKQYPLVIFLHGSGERGNDNEKQLTHGAKLFLKDENRKDFPAIVVFPQCSQNSYWSNVQITGAGKDRAFEFVTGGAPSVAMQMVMELTQKLMATYPVQKKQVYVMGLSMGGMGTFEIVNRMPKTFAAAVPICGGANPSIAPRLKGTHWWVFHGGKDDVVLPKYSEDMVAAMKKAKVKVRFTLFQEANHNSWDATFAEPALLPWLFGKKR